MRRTWLTIFALLGLLVLLRGPAHAEEDLPDDTAETAETAPAPAPDDTAPAPAPTSTSTEDAPAPSSEDAAREQMMSGLAMTDAERAEYAVALRQVVAQVRGKVLAKIASKVEAKQSEKLDRFALVLSGFALCGVFLLAMPFVLRRRYPGRAGTLWKYSGLAALLFFLAVNLFAGVLIAMRTTQGALGSYTNPQVKIVESTFDLFANKADELAVIGPMLIEPTLASLSGESDRPVVSQMLENAQRLKADFTIFSSVASLFDKIDWLFGLLPIVLVVIALLLFVKVARPTLAEIVHLPERAASGVEGAARATVRLTLRNVWAEAKAAFATMGVLVVLTVLAGMLLGIVLQPALEVFISYLTMSLLYVQLSPSASTFWVMFSLVGSIVFLVLNLAVVILASAFFLGKAQQIFQRKFREGVPLRAHLRFWKRGGLAAVWTQVLPVLYILVAVEGIGWVAEKSMEKFFDAENPANSSWGLILGSGPALFLVTFGVVFWAARGVAALKLLATYKPAAIEAPASAPPRTPAGDVAVAFARVPMPDPVIVPRATTPPHGDDDATIPVERFYDLGAVLASPSTPALPRDDQRREPAADQRGRADHDPRR